MAEDTPFIPEHDGDEYLDDGDESMTDAVLAGILDGLERLKQQEKRDEN